MRYLFLITLSLTLTSQLFGQHEKLDQLLSDFNTYAEEQRKEWKVAGMAIAIVHEENVILSKGYGQRGLEDKRPVDLNTLFQIGSLTKAFTAASVAIAVEKGWLKWEDYVIDHLPTFRMQLPWVSTQFQMQDLLAQRSGLPPYAGDTQAFLGFTPTDMLDNLRYLTPVSSFRSQYAYQNVFFVAAARVIEEITKASYQEFYRKEIFLPLEMTKTTTSLKDYIAAENRAEWLMRLNNGSTIRLREDFDGREWNYVLGAAGGINSTITDMSKWLMLQVNQGKYKDKQLMTSGNMKRMTRPMIYASDFSGHAMYYALGWVHMDYSPHPITWHDGSTLGVYNVMAFIPEEKIGIVILTNTRNTQLALGLTLDFLDRYLGNPDQKWSQQLLAKVKEEQAKRPEIKRRETSPPLPLTNYTGTYHSPIYGDAVVKETANGLTLTLGAKKLQLPLTPWDRDIFAFDWAIIQDAPSKVIFIPDASGNYTTMQIDTILKEGGGSFKKRS